MSDINIYKHGTRLESTTVLIIMRARTTKAIKVLGTCDGEAVRTTSGQTMLNTHDFAKAARRREFDKSYKRRALDKMLSMPREIQESVKQVYTEAQITLAAQRGVTLC